MLKSWGLRSAFVFIFPIIIGLMLFLVFSGALNRLEQLRQQQIEDDWLNHASILAAKIRSEYTTALQSEKALRKAAEQIENTVEFSDKSLPETVAEAFTKNLPVEIAAKCKIWAFANDNNSCRLLENDLLMSQKKRAFIRVFEALTQLSTDTAESANTRKHERFISGMFGENSSPQHLATERQGLLTSVVFERNHAYLCWRQINLGNNRYVGFICILPGVFVEDNLSAMQRLVNKLYEETNSYTKSLYLPVFVNSLQLEPEVKPIVPEQIRDNTAATELTGLLRKEWKNGSIKPRQLNKKTEGWLFFDNIDAETPFSLVVLEKTSYSKDSSITVNIACFILLLAIWVVFFIRRQQKGGVSLPLAFKLLFFLTGMLPVAVLVIMAIRLINESAEVSIKTRINSSQKALRAINEKAEDISNWCGVIVGEQLKAPQLQKQLTSDNGSEGFNFLCNSLAAHNYNLHYMLLFKSGQEPRFLISSPSQTVLAKFHLDYFAVSCEAITQLLATYRPGLPGLKLSTLQRTLFNVFNDIGSSIAKEIFLDSLERVTYLQIGNSTRNFFYSSILSGKDGLPCFVVLSIGAEQTFSQLLTRELSQSNNSDNATIVCINRNISASNKILPAQAQKFIQTPVGQKFHEFIDSAASSYIGLVLRDSDNIFIYEPMLKLGLYCGGAAIDISDLKREMSFRKFLLLLVVIALSLIIYLLSTATARIFIEPTKELAGVFAKIADGDYLQKFNYSYDNELGELAKATNNMVTGLKERQLLGKFVSTTFDNQVLNATAVSTAKKMSGVILFCDIRSFTTLSEANPPEVLSQMLNHHLYSMVNAINANNGQVEQFIGDAVVAFFHGDSRQSCVNALKAATGMMLQHHEINARRRQQSLFTYKIGIGLAYGQVIAGILSSGTRSEFTILGVARSLAEQLEASSKTARHTGIIASYELAQMLDDLSEYFVEHEDKGFELIDLEKFI
ncbi:MAG: adenylate/guanylate cyclase domain-containing protein [Candidatus Riflebacteria bacterium]|nr:adenylate/guanylate cyclase domain-containing protein [Candidatus Riflebacteria bacterium]